METRRGRRSVIDLTASVSPPDGPRPLIATASIAPRRRLRDGSHSSRSSTATLSDVIGTMGTASGSGSGSGVRPSERKRTGSRQNSDGGHASASSDSRTGSSQRPEASAGPRKRPRIGTNIGSEERSNSSAMSRSPLGTTRPVIIPRTSNIRTNHPSPRPTINDFEAESSDENSPGGTISASAANEIVQETDEEDEDKTDTMTVNADAASESEMQQFEILEDSELESGSVPLRDTVMRTSQDIEEIQINALASGVNDDDMDGFEIVSPVQITKDLKHVSNSKDRSGNRYPSDSVKGKGKAIAVAAPGEPPENLLASFECPICFMPPAQAVLTPCGHIMCGKCLFDTLKSQAIRDGKRPNLVGQYPVSRPPQGRRRTKKEIELERSRPALKGRILTGSCPVCRKELEGGFGTIAGEGGVRYLEIRTLTEL